MNLNFLPEPGDFLAANGTRLHEADLARMAQQADYVLMGELHTSPCDHEAQSRLAWSLASRDVPFVLGLEMIPANTTEALERFNRGEIAAEELEQALDWSEMWGYPFRFFLDTFRAAAKVGAPVHGLNVPPSLIKKTREMGVSTVEGLDDLPPEERVLLPEEVIPPPQEQIEELEQALRHHPEDENATAADSIKRRERFLFIQSVWDTKMAEEAVQLRRRYGATVLVLAGETHVRHGHGVRRRLRKLDPDADVLLVAGLRSLDGWDPSAADVFFYCPLQHKSRLGMVLQQRGDEVVVTEVTPGERAAEAGLRPGDVLVEAQGIEVEGLMDLHRAGTRAHREDAALVFEIRRGGERYRVDLGKLGRSRSR